MPNRAKALKLACFALILSNLAVIYALLCDIHWVKLLAVAWLGIQSLDHIKNTNEAIAEIESRNNSQ